MSQRAHERLRDKYRNTQDSPHNTVHWYYHENCLSAQRKSKQVLPTSERKKIFAFWCKHEGYNPTSSKKRTWQQNRRAKKKR